MHVEVHGTLPEGQINSDSSEIHIQQSNQTSNQPKHTAGNQNNLQLGADEEQRCIMS